MNSETQKQLLLELLDRLLRSWWTVVAGGCIGIAAAVIGLHFTKPVYEATATIEADVETLPSELVRRTISDDVELSLADLRAAVLSDENLRVVIKTVFGKPQSDAHEQALASRITSNVSLQFSPRTQTIFVRFRDRVPDRAAWVANLLAEFFVTENKGLRAENARQVRESMEALAVGVGSELEVAKRALNEFLRDHSMELEIHRVDHERAIERLQVELEENEDAIKAASRRLRVLESQYGNKRSGETGDKRIAEEPQKGRGGDPRIAQLEREIEELLTNLTENHPDVVRKRQELERRRAASASQSGPATAAQDPHEESELPASIPSLEIWSTRLEAARLVVKNLEDKSPELSREIARYRAYLRNMPATQKEVDDLTARVSVLDQASRENQLRIETARAGQQLEAEDIANPFVLSLYAAPPVEPVWPSRGLFLGVGAVLGLLVFTGPILAKGALKPIVLSEASVSLLDDTPVLVAIPLIPTPGVARLRRRAALRNFGLSALAVTILATVAVANYVGLI